MAGSGRAEIRVGIGGWTFAPWRGVFYPAGLRQASELEYASRKVTAIEINGTFYGSQKPESFRKWRDETPEDFVFSVKGPRFATHRSNLSEAAPSIERFFGSGVYELGAKLGPVLWQFPPTTRFDEANIGAFLALLPREHAGRQIRHVLEVRHDSFADPAFAALLKRHDAAVALVDSAKQPLFDAVTAGFVYARLKSAAEDIASGYTPEALAQWRERLGKLAAEGAKTPRDCFVFFINGAKVRAPAAAQAFLQLLAA